MTPTQIDKKRRQARQLRAKAASTTFPEESRALVAKAVEIESALPPAPPEVRIVEKIVYVDRPRAADGERVVYVREARGPFSGGTTAARARAARERAGHG